jgi:hypothetical protein
MFTAKRLHRLTDYKESSPEGLSASEHVTPLLRPNLVTSWVLYFSPFPFRHQFYWLVYRRNVSVKCLAQEHNIVAIFARHTHSESDQARRCLSSLTRLNAHTLAVRHYTTIFFELYSND